MKASVYLIADRKGVVRMTKTRPALHRQEIAVQLNITIPDSSFLAPFLTASLNVAESQVIQPIVELEITDQPPQTEGAVS